MAAKIKKLPEKKTTGKKTLPAKKKVGGKGTVKKFESKKGGGY